MYVLALHECHFVPTRPIAFRSSILLIEDIIVNIDFLISTLVNHDM
jgi:hypothetical protein